MTPTSAPTRGARWGARWVDVAVVAGLLLAVVIPPAATAHWLHPAGDIPADRLTAGIWITKVMLAVSLLAVWVVRWLFPADAAPFSNTSAHTASSAGPSAAPSAPQSAPWWPIALLLAVGLALRIPALGEGPWYDEIQTQITYVRLPFGALLTTYDSTNQHLLFSLSAHAVQLLAGESTATLRLPAVIFGVLSLWATVSFGRRWMTEREAWWSAALLAVSYHHVWFSQNARGYTALLLGTIVGTSLFLPMLRGVRRTTLDLWAYAIVMALTVMTHVTALAVVAAHGLCWLWRWRSLERGTTRWAPLAALVLAGMLSVLVYAPVLPQLLGGMDSAQAPKAANEWQNPAWFIAEAIRSLVLGIPGGLIVVPTAGAVAAVGLAMAWQRDRIATVLMLLPLFIMAALVLGTGHNLWPRFFFFGAAFIVQLAVRGGFGVLSLVFSRVTPPHGARNAQRLGDAGLVLITVASLVILPRAWQPKQDYAAAVAWVEQHAAPGDAIVVTDLARMPVREWLKKDWPVVNTVSELDSIMAVHPKTWVLYTFRIRLETMTPELNRQFDARFSPVFDIPSTVGGGEIVILSAPVNSPTSSRTK
ncbi:MAG: glycosyltransferase family 39 protein [Gemmatimonadaceae bacterium]|nr:glycosyltransferase family 39 protein [Gemmatimonadaceae bacterium]